MHYISYDIMCIAKAIGHYALNNMPRLHRSIVVLADSLTVFSIGEMVTNTL